MKGLSKEAIMSEEVCPVEYVDAEAPHQIIQ
jgi:hypothetical protein